MKQITFTPDKLKALKREYAKAVKEQKESFQFEGGELLTAYAKYMIEYLDSQFKSK